MSSNCYCEQCSIDNLIERLQLGQALVDDFISDKDQACCNVENILKCWHVSRLTKILDDFSRIVQSTDRGLVLSGGLCPVNPIHEVELGCPILQFVIGARQRGVNRGDFTVLYGFFSEAGRSKSTCSSMESGDFRLAENILSRLLKGEQKL